METTIQKVARLRDERMKIRTENASVFNSFEKVIEDLTEAEYALKGEALAAKQTINGRGVSATFIQGQGGLQDRVKIEYFN